MKVEEFERYLTEEELEMFKERLHDPYNEHIAECYQLWEVIFSAFSFKESEVDLWNKIAQRKQPVR